MYWGVLVQSERLSVLFWAASCALSLPGCVNTPDTKPQVAEIQSQSLGLGNAPAPAITETWWTAFDDPQANRLVDLMFKANPGLQAAMARIRSAQAELASDQSQQFPQIQLDGQVQRELLSNDYLYPAPYGGSYRWGSDIQGKMNWALDFWGKQAALIDRARNLEQARTLDTQAARLALLGSFAQAYVSLLLSYQNQDIAEEDVSERQSILELTQSRLASGLENEASLQQANALLAQAQADVMSCKADEKLAAHALAALSGQGADLYDQIVRPVASLDSSIRLPDVLPADLLSRRADILAARARVKAALRGRDAAKADFYPNIDLTAALGFQAVGLNSLLSANALTMAVGPAIHLPIFDAGKLRAQYASATADLDLAVADYNDAVLTSVRQASDALTEIASLNNRRGAQQRVLDSANQAFLLAKERYRLGVSDQIVVLTTEGLLLQARRQLVALEAQLATERITLLLSIGGGLSQPVGPEAIQGNAHDG